MNCGFEKEHNEEYITIYTKDNCIEILCQKNVYYPYDCHFDVCFGKELKYVHVALDIFVFIGCKVHYDNQEPIAYLTGWVARCIDKVKRNKVE